MPYARGFLGGSHSSCAFTIQFVMEILAPKPGPKSWPPLVELQQLAAQSKGISMMLSTDSCCRFRGPAGSNGTPIPSSLSRRGRVCGRSPRGRCRGWEGAWSAGLAGVPVEEHLGGDRFEAGILGAEPVRCGVTFDVGPVTEQFPCPQ